MSLQQALAVNLKRFRKLRNMTQAELAEKVVTSTSYIGEIESLKKFPSHHKLENLARALNIQPYELFIPDHLHLSDRDRLSFTRKMTQEIRDFLDGIEKKHER